MYDKMSTTYTILLAEDDDDDSFLFREALHEIDSTHKVEVAGDGEMLFSMLSDMPLPDIIFLDLNMPKKDGMTTLKEIRNKQELSSVPIVIFSTSSDKQYIITAYKYGADLYISKPDTFMKLKKAIGYCIARKGELKRPINIDNFYILNY